VNIGAEFEVRVLDGNRTVGLASGHNLMTQVGLNLVAQVFNWSGVQAENVPQQLGQPSAALSTVELTSDLYGAIGTSTTAAAATDVQLGSEVQRTIVSQASVANNVVTWLFYFPPTTTVATITEAGVFANGGPAANSGVLLDHVVFATGVNKGSNQGVLLTATFTVGG